MREIKFRVWEQLNGKMHYLDFALYEFSEGLNSHKFVLPPNRQGLQNPYTMMNLDAVKVMQYTGINDSKGKEIYEGDIVKVNKLTFESSAPLPENLTVTYYGGMFQFFRGKEPLMGLHLTYLDDGEIIGNIFENPELITA